VIEAGMIPLIVLWSVLAGVIGYKAIDSKPGPKPKRKVESKIPDYCETRLMKDHQSGDIYKIVECNNDSDPPTIQIITDRKIKVKE